MRTRCTEAHRNTNPILFIESLLKNEGTSDFRSLAHPELSEAEERYE